MTLQTLLNRATTLLSGSCLRPQYEASLLLAHFLGQERIYLTLNRDKTIENPQDFWKLIERRANHEPFEYIVGKVSFYDIELFINKGVLIPRPETEILIDKASQIIEQKGIGNMVEIGVGSGAISIVLARKFPHLHIIATDLYKAPLQLAQKNIEHFGIKNIQLLQCNLMDEVQGDIDLVVSNPPYIANGFELETNVKAYEPHAALFGGRVGDELLKQITLDTQKRGVKYLACEMGYDQKEPLRKFFDNNGIKHYRFYQDLARLDRGFV
ncbi:MAG: peptide chain release factor N(5)-glutamine methyltransferase, partial [Campylobacterales bacterium]|nr:peptide chain release factor N(5)-glutamine methyltransferase [Campylobacterales bacterium]